MIISTHIDVKISNQGKYYANLGYENVKQGTILRVPLEYLPKNSNKLVKCACDTCGEEFKRPFQLLNKEKKLHSKDLCFKCTRNLVGASIDQTKQSKKNRERSGEKHPRWNPNKSAMKTYYSKVRQLTEENYVRDIDIINPLRLPRTLCGVDNGYQLDHRVSIKKRFMFGINPKVIASTDNLQMLPWTDNRSKGA